MRTNTISGVARAARPLAFGLTLFAGAGSIAGAQTTTPMPPPPPTTNANPGAFDPTYDSITAWDARWDAGTYDRRHVLIGTIADSKPYRILLSPADPDDHATAVDLKNGTVIRPEGTTLVAGMRVAMFGYWSKGTFIANRVVLRQS